MLNTRNHFYLVNVGIPLLIAVVTLLAFDMTELDRVISDLFYIPQTHSFVAQHNHWFEKLTHKWPRYLPNVTGGLALTGALMSLVWPLLAKLPKLQVLLDTVRLGPVLRFTTAYRRDFWFVAISFSIATGLVHYFKSHTDVYCPVELVQYGGSAIRHEWYENLNFFHQIGHGRCWPGGHASAGYSMLALYFVARSYRWKYSTLLLKVVLVLGSVYGTTKVMQGWHFMSHTFWAGVMVWLANFALAMAFYGRERLSAPLASRAEPATSAALVPAA